MEKIPNMVYNDWGGYLQYPIRTGWRSGDYRQMVPQEQQAYESLVKDLFKRADIVIRDVTNPANMGFRNDGTPVWFDATVSTWPIHAKMKDSPRLMDREQYDLFAAIKQRSPLLAGCSFKPVIFMTFPFSTLILSPHPTPQYGHVDLTSFILFIIISYITKYT